MSRYVFKDIFHEAQEYFLLMMNFRGVLWDALVSVGDAVNLKKKCLTAKSKEIF